VGGAAEFRGPGIHNHFEGNPDEYEIDHDRSRPFNVRSGRIILLGDGSTLIPGKQNDEELFDQTGEENHPDQVQRQNTDTERNDREGTPGPQSATSQTNTSASDGSEPSNTPQKPASS
jgi:protein phosphatase 2C family protein 2/3